jgi:RNA polymerase sigma factor (sigma-70 family)
MYLHCATPCKPPEALAFRPSARLKKPMAVEKAPLPVSAKAPAESLEAQLVRVGASKDREAFAALFQYFAPRLKSYMLKHGAGEAAAEEIVQNTFITIWEKAAGFDPKKAAASTWVFTIARNKRIDALRREKYIEVDVDDPALQLAAEEKEENYADVEDVDKLNAALATLPDEQKKLLRMAFYEDKSHSDIAKETKIPLGTVKSRLRLAMEKLRGKMQGGAA